MDSIHKNLSFPPNLENYEHTYNTFRWEDHQKDLPYLESGRINAGHILTDFKLEEKKDKIALFWENDKGDQKIYTFGEITALSNKLANVLVKKGIKKGDRVFTFLPRLPEAFYVFFGILKTGAVAGNFFPAFGKEALFERLKNSGAKVLITTKELSVRIEEIKKDLPDLQDIILIDEDLPSLLENEPDTFIPVPLELNDPLFMLFTSATGNTPISGIVVPQRALLQEYFTGLWVLDLKPADIYWCTADPGWVTGTVYGLMVPFMLGISQVVYDGRFSPESWYKIIEKHKVTVWYTAPTALRMLASKEDIIKDYNLSSLRHLVSVGEALNPFLVDWSLKVYGIPIHDTYWQTETGAMMITNFPCLDIKPGSMGKPIPGIEAKIVDDDGNELPDETEGNLVFKKPFPGMLSDVWQNPDAYKRYFTPPNLDQSNESPPPVIASEAKLNGSEIPLREQSTQEISPKSVNQNIVLSEISRTHDTLDACGTLDTRGTRDTSPYFYTGDHCKRDKDGYFWFIGRANDVIKTSGERVGPFEVESVINKHPQVLESGVIGKPDELRGAIIKAFIVLRPGVEPNDGLKEDIQKFMKAQLAGHAYPREIEFVASLPKNRSGKIVRRILKAKELGQSLGDTSTLVDSG